MVTLNNLCLPIVGVALMVSAAAVCGCSEKKPVYTEADVAAAGERVEALMTGFAAKKYEDAETELGRAQDECLKCNKALDRPGGPHGH